MLPTFSKRHLLAKTLDLTGVGRALRSVHAWEGILILNYHRIGDGGRSMFDHNLWSADEEEFEQQVSLLARRFDVIGLPDLERALSDSHGRYVMITFDDGYRDNYSSAFPILKRHGVPATFFLTTGFLDRPQVPWWDEIAWMVRSSTISELKASQWLATTLNLDETNRERAISRLLSIYKKLPGEEAPEYVEWLASALETGRCPQGLADELWMTWDMVREMEANGMSFGGHTVTHPILANLSSEQQEWEVAECQNRLTRELGHPADSFSYPVGGRSSFNIFTRMALAQHGFRWGFTYTGGLCRPGHTDLLAINRAAVEVDVDGPLFRAMTTLPQLFA